MSHTIEHRHIVVVGAGPAGLTCARILQRHGLEVTVYDLDRDAHTRSQGGSLDLHETDGQLALREAGLYERFLELARPEGQEMREIDPATGTVLARHLPEEGELSAPEIDRGELRDLLLESLEPGSVRWGHKLLSVDGNGDGPRRLTFADGSAVTADLVVGADGAWSRVRRVVSDALPRYSGVDFLEAWFEDVTHSHLDLAALVGEGSAMAHDTDGALFAQRGGQDRMRVYIVRRRPADWMARRGLEPADTGGIRAHVLDEFDGWSPELMRLVTDNDGPYVHRPLYVLPAPHTWAHRPGVTLIGDAAHLVPPVGVGVNLAMLDGCELALALAGAASVDDAVRTYEATMLPRSAALAVELDGRADFLLDDGDTPEYAKDAGQG